MGSLHFSSELLMTKIGALFIGHARLENLEKQIEKLSKFANLEFFVWIDKGKDYIISNVVQEGGYIASPV